MKNHRHLCQVQVRIPLLSTLVELLALHDQFSDVTSQECERELDTRVDLAMTQASQNG